MAYYIRAFCTTGKIPTVLEILHWLESQEVRVRPDDGDDLAVAQQGDWNRVALVYRGGKEPIVATCLRSDNPRSEAAQQVEHFIEEVGPAGRSSIKRRIIDHLKNTRFIIILDVPASDMDDGGWDANGQILTYLLDHCNALIQADGEGFYEGSKLILPMETA